MIVKSEREDLVRYENVENIECNMQNGNEYVCTVKGDGEAVDLYGVGNVNLRGETNSTKVNGQNIEVDFKGSQDLSWDKKVDILRSV